MYVCVCKTARGNLRVNLEQVVVLGVSSEKIGDADDGAAERPPVLHAAEILLLASSHPPCTHAHTHAPRNIHSHNSSATKAQKI